MSTTPLPVMLPVPKSVKRISVYVAVLLFVRVPEISQLSMYGTPAPVGVVMVRFVIFNPAIVQPVFVLTVPEIKVFPPTRPGAVNTVY